MFEKKILKPMIAVIVVACMLLLLVACATPQASAAAPAASSAAAPAAPAASVAATAAPAASVAAPAPAAGVQPFKDIKVDFFCGGGEGDVFATTVYNGAKQAESDLGCKVQYIWSDWDPNKMVSQLKDSVARKPDGICIMGHPGDDAYKSIVDDAESQGIIVTSQNTTLPNLEAQYKTKGFGYVGQELYASGVTLATEAAKRAGLKSGDKAMVWGLAAQPGRGERTKGCVDALKKLGVKVDYIEISDAINKDPAQGTPTLTSYLAANPDCKMVVTDHGSLTATLPTFLKAAGKNPGDVYGAGFDLSGNTSTGITDGWIGCVLDQQQWLQGYLPVLQVCLTKAYGFAGLHVDTGAAIIDKTNISFVKPLAEKGIR